MKQLLFFLFAFFSILLTADNLQGQSTPPAKHGGLGLGTKVGPAWTLLSNNDNLVFEAKADACHGHSMLMLKVQNNTGKEVHLFVSLSIQGGFHAPKRLLMLKASQTIEIGCDPSIPFKSIPLHDIKEPIVSLDYKINKQL